MTTNKAERLYPIAAERKQQTNVLLTFVFIFNSRSSNHPRYSNVPAEFLQADWSMTSTD